MTDDDQLNLTPKGRAAAAWRDQPLVEALKAKQDGRTIKEFAAHLNITSASLSRILSGKRGVGAKVLHKIFSAYPDLCKVWLDNNDRYDCKRTTAPDGQIDFLDTLEVA